MSKKNLSIQDLALNFINNKNNENFTKLINRIKPGITSFAYKYVKDKDMANDVISKVFITIWEKIDQYNPKYNFSTWVYAITKNESLLNLKNKNNKVLSYDKYTENSFALFENKSLQVNNEYIIPQKEELIQKLYDASVSAINELDEPYKTVMVEREINQKQLHVIASDLTWNLSTVKTRLRKARKDVADILYNKYPELVDTYFKRDNS